MKRQNLKSNFMTASLISVALSGWFLLTACAASGNGNSTPQTVETLANPNAFNLVSYNVENLFDSVHDEGKKDAENTMSPEVLKIKLERVADTVFQVKGQNNKLGPDILVVTEVENINVLTMLNQGHLKAAGYQTVELIEGEDVRGIDIGVLSRFPLAAPARLHKIEFSDASRRADTQQLPLTRGIMEVPLTLPDGKTLYVYGVHLPSQSNPVVERQEAVATLKKLIEAKPAGSLQIIAGDFNILASEGLFANELSSFMRVSHLVSGTPDRGSHYYRGEWSFLDGILTSPSLDARVKWNTFHTLKDGKYQLFPNKTPARFDAKKAIGVSDHLPLYVEFN